MPRRATGQIVEPNGKQKSFALRFTAYGKRRFVTLGTPAEGWTREKAAEELRYTLDRVKRGHWSPPARATAPADAFGPDTPSFHEFASRWLLDREPELAERTVDDYRWALCHYLLPFFAKHALHEITIQEVDRYKATAVRCGRLSNNSINKTLTRLGQILETAVEYDLITSNPAAGKRRRLKGSKPSRTHVEPEQLMTLLTAAERLAGTYQPVARPILATLAGAGLRIGEALDLEWRDISLGARTVRVRESKTERGYPRS
ncbi:MAG: tyrosine-type recombinase/integrase [Solirubrobacterales bacterium]|nr:tyrosine-type recombinase/integrase [Solirubrobacterales bacterium]